MKDSKKERPLQRQGAALRGLDALEPERLQQELQSHRFELEAQNDQLRRTQQELHESRDRYRELYDLAPVAYVTVGAGDKIIEANRVATTLFGVEKAELLDRVLPAFMSTVDADAFYRYRQALLAKRVVSGCEVHLLLQRGHRVPVRIDAALISTPVGAGASFHCALVDLSEILEYQEKLQRMAFDAAISDQRERRRIAAHVHDHIGQALAVAQMKIAGVRAEAAGEARKSLDTATEMLVQSIAHVRTLTFELSPPILHDLGLSAALQWLAERMEERHGVAIEVDVAANPVFREDADLAALLFRFVQELLMNVVKHAKTNKARVSLGVRGANIRIDVQDFGAGFDTGVGGPNSGFGLFSVREQTSRLGGHFKVDSVLGKGTHASIIVPTAAIERIRGDASRGHRAP